MFPKPFQPGLAGWVQFLAHNRTYQHFYHGVKERLLRLSCPGRTLVRAVDNFSTD